MPYVELELSDVPTYFLNVVLEMPIRRHSDPINVKRIWDAIRAANQARQVADVPRITKYLQNIDDCTQTQAELYIKQTLKDKLIV